MPSFWNARLIALEQVRDSLDEIQCSPSRSSTILVGHPASRVKSHNGKHQIPSST